ncbi:MAG: protoglobin domain-containing protein [Thermodesulfovibrio sp.]|nr:protoglobin domain-containing protein [Thermodesulfovibrio sp.]MCX7723852.1 protoglobin domain-containing protein [Thermodesulfovibrio sp.]
MRPFKEIKANYYFTKEDESRLNELRPLMEKRVDKVVGALYQWIIQTESVKKVFKNESLINHVMRLVKSWFIALFAGRYDNYFYDSLIRIGQKHERVGVDPHFMTRAMNIIRNACVDIIYEEIEKDREKYIISINKILDINLDIITSSYLEEEIKGYSPAYKIRFQLVRYVEIFSQFVSLVLIFALSILTFAVIYLCGKDIYQILSGKLEQTIITALGSVLILWVMLELLNTEIAHLRGGKFRISVFIGVALVTVIRETMIATLKHETIEFIISLIAAILIIGIVYWLVKKTEEEKR